METVTFFRNMKTHFRREIREVLLREREGEGITLFRNRKIHCLERERRVVKSVISCFSH